MSILAFDDSGGKGRTDSLEQLDFVNHYIIMETDGGQVSMWTRGVEPPADLHSVYCISKSAVVTKGATVPSLRVQLHAVKLMSKNVMMGYAILERRIRSLLEMYAEGDDANTRQIYSRVDNLVDVLKHTKVDPGIFDARLGGNSCSLWDLYPIKQHALAKFAQRASAKATQVEERVNAVNKWMIDTKAKLQGMLKGIAVMDEQLAKVVDDDIDAINNLSLQRYLILSPIPTLLNDIGRQRENVAGFLTVAVRNHKDTVSSLKLLRDFPIHYRSMKEESLRRKQWARDVNQTYRWVNEKIKELHLIEGEARARWLQSIPRELRNRLGDLSESNPGSYPRFHVEPAVSEDGRCLIDGIVGVAPPENADVAEYEERIQYLEHQLYIRDNRHKSAMESMRQSRYETEQELTTTLLQQQEQQRLLEQKQQEEEEEDNRQSIVTSDLSYNDRVVFIRESVHRYVAVCESQQEPYVLSEQLTSSLGKSKRPLYLIATLIMAPERHQAVKGNVYKFPIGTVYWECQATIQL